MKYALLLLTLGLLWTALPAQNIIYQTIDKNPIERYPLVELFTDFGTLEPTEQQQLPLLERAGTFTINASVREQLLSQPTAPMRLLLPFPNGDVRQVLLIPARNLSENFQAYNQARIPYELNEEDAHHYWGVIEGETQSAVALSVFREEVSGLIVRPGQAYNIAILPNGDDRRHLLFATNELNLGFDFECGVSDDAINATPPPAGPTAGALSSGPGNCVRMYVEVEYDVFVDKGNLANTVNYVTGLFNQITLMYFNEAITLNLHELIVWEEEDPYTGASTSVLLDQFVDNTGLNFNGDLAHLVGYSGSGGLAYVDVLCNTFFSKHAYSGINATYQDIPVYSWSVEVVTHEIGHNLGSPHTHACAWNGNDTAIDRCGIEAGYGEDDPCNADAPVPAAGTVMSYCHLVGGASSIDLALGFGPQPGDLIRDRVYNAPCLVPCEPSPEVCDDNFDNDFDGLTDCEDPDCVDFVDCLPCEQNIVNLVIVFDEYPQETSWSIVADDGTIVESSDTYTSTDALTTLEIELCLDDACYTFTISDSFGDGMCCTYGEGSYTFSNAAGDILATGGDFGASEAVVLCDGAVAENCNDGVDNDQDGLIDCEDPDCDTFASCTPCTDNIVTFEINFDNYPEETSWQIEDDQSNVLYTGFGSTDNPDGSTANFDYCLPDGCYDFVIFDSANDGICCGFGQGAYNLFNTLGEAVAGGGEFTTEDRTTFCISGTECPAGTTYTVTTTEDFVAGSLRQAILCTNAQVGLDTIVFDPAVDSIQITEKLPVLRDDRVVIDGGGTVVVGYSGPEELFSIESDYVTITNMRLRRTTASYGIGVSTSFTANNCNISHNQFDGFQRNLFLWGSNGLIRNNVFTAAGDDRIIYLLGSSGQMLIDSNHLVGSGNGYGMHTQCNNLQVRDNTFSNLDIGIYSQASNSVFIERNVIHDNAEGIVVESNGATGQQHLISQNSFYCNTNHNGIQLNDAANGLKQPPVLTELTNSTLSGTALPGDIIEIYLSDNTSCASAAPCQGKVYLGLTLADGDGAWIYNDLMLAGGEQLTALAIDADNNTSSFADCLAFCAVVSVELQASAAVVCPGDSVVLRLASSTEYEGSLAFTYLENGTPVTVSDFSLTDSLVLHPEMTTAYALVEVTADAPCGLEFGAATTIVTVIDTAVPTPVDLEICNGESAVIAGETIAESGIYNETLTSSVGCDSLIEINLTVLPPITSSATIFLCEGDSTQLYGNTVSEAGVYEHTYVSAAGCDSVHQVTVAIIPSLFVAEDLSICAGESIDIFGNDVSEAGVYEATFTRNNGCDSVHQITLEVLSDIATSSELQICEGQTVELFGEPISTAGTYSGDFTASTGCDSTHTVTVSVVTTITTFAEYVICPGMTIFIAGEDISAPGAYEFLLTSEAGCDSIHQAIVMDATIPMTESAMSICAGESVQLFGEEVTTAGSYTGTLTSSVGCDSIHTVQLEVLEPVATTETLQACTGQSIELFGETYTSDAVTSATFVGSNGCDSTHQVTLTFTEAINTSAEIEICSGSELTLFGETVTNAGTYTGEFVTAAGCDSIHQVTVTVSDVIMTEEALTLCAGNTIILFGEEVGTAGLYSGEFVTAAGCDSIHQVMVTVNDPVTVNAEMSICAGESVVIFGETQTEPGLYSTTFTGSNGCDSTQIIELQVLQPSFSESEIAICTGESAVIFGETQTVAGIYSATFTGSNGCDSTAIVQLTVNEAPQAEVAITAACAETAAGAISLTSDDDNLTYTWAHTPENSSELSDLAPGTYFLSVTNGGGCTLEMELEVPALSLPDYNLNVTPLDCNDENSGIIQLLTDDELQVSINGGGFSNQLSFGNLTAGVYTLEIMTEAGCASTEVVTLDAAESLTLANSTLVQPACPGDEDGSIALEMEGGNTGLTFLWQNGQESATLSGVASGAYSVTVTNANGCQWEATFELTDLAPIDANLQLQLGCGDGQIIAIAGPSAGMPPYSLEWSTSQSGTVIANLSSGSYALSVTDANGCTITETFDIPYIEPFAVEENVVDASCSDSQDGSIDLMITGGIPPYNISWDNGATEGDLDNLSIGNYTYNVSSGSCGTSATVTVSAPAALGAQIVLELDAQANVQATALVGGGTPPYEYAWSNGGSGMVATNLTIGQTLTLTLTDANGCEFTDEVLVTLTATDQATAAQFRIFPNPTSGRLFVEHSLSGAFTYQVEVYHPTGAGRVWQEEVSATQHELSLEHLPAGVYLVVVSNADFRRVERVVLVK